MTKQYISVSRINLAEKASLGFRFERTDETRNYVLDEIKQWFNKWEV